VNRDIDESSENVLSEWSRRVASDDPPRDEGPEARERQDEPDAEPPEGTAPFDFSQSPEGLESAERPEGLESAERPEEAESQETPDETPALDDTQAWGAVQASPETEVAAEPVVEEEEAEEQQAALPEPEPEPEEEQPMFVSAGEHAAGDLRIPDGYAVLEGDSTGGRRAVGVVVSRFNGEVTSQLLERALAELSDAGVAREVITVLVVPGAFELPLAATALAKTRRFACIVALGCVIRGETPHFEYVAGEAASGLQLAALETGVPVSFGVLTLETRDQADARIEKGAEAVRTALEMADVFAHLRAAAAR
jgi:6,7-dimethyl-8-ribityllumazine synthase